MFTPEQGFDFVCKRGRAMQAAGEANPGAMAAVLKLSNEQVEALCAGFEKVWPVNYNCPGQLVCAGEKSQIEAFCQKVEEAGGRAKMLAVSGGFHSLYGERQPGPGPRAGGDGAGPLQGAGVRQLHRPAL